MKKNDLGILDLAEIKEEQAFDTIDSDLLAEEIDPSILDHLLSTDMKEEYVCTTKAEDTENVPVKIETLRSRYHELGEEDLNAIADANSEKTTKKQTKWAIQIFKGKFLKIIVKRKTK